MSDFVKDANVSYEDTISRQAAIDALDEQIAQCNKAIKSFVLSMKDEYAAKVEKASLTAFRERLEYLPPAQPQRTGKWIRNGWAITCSECGYDMPYTVRNFCPNCGAKMTEGDAE